MSETTKKDWRELAAAVASEHDPKKLEGLVEELLRALDNKPSQFQSQVGSHQAAGTNHC